MRRLSMATNDAIVVEGLSMRYPGKRGGIEALSNVEFAVQRGDVFGFLGPNGAGKTTTLRILATVFAPSAGTAEVNGHDVVREALAVRAAIGYMPENPGDYPLLTGLQNLLYWARLEDVEPDVSRERAKTLLSEFGLAEAMDQKVKTYSHGMRKRLLMAQALVHDPAVLLLDEPAGGLDPQGIHFFREVALRLQKQGKTVLLSSHILSEVQQTCHTVGVIVRGRMVTVEPIDALLKRIGAHVPLRVEIECEGATLALVDELHQIPGVRLARSTQSGVEIEADPGAAVVDKATRVLVAGSVSIKAIRPVEPTLEDAFLSLTGDGPT